MTLSIETLARWSAPKRVTTKHGDRMLRKAEPTKAFSAAWKANKEALKAVGLSWSKDDRTGAWEVCWWQPISADQAAVQAQQAAEAAKPAEDALTPDQEARLLALAPKLLSYQVASVRRVAGALVKHGGALDASDTGTGKTFVALAACEVLGRQAYVVCPKAVVPSWRRAAEHFGAELAGVCNYELLRRGEQPAVAKVGEGKDEDFLWKLPAETVIVFDECHRMKDYKTWNSALGLAALRQGYKVVGLSATAADNPMQMKFAGLLARCFESEKRFFPWMMRNGVTKGRFGLEFTGGRRVLDDIHRQIFPQHGTRLRIADLGDAFPETQIAAEAYELNGAASEIARVYDEMAEAIARIAASEAADKGACILVEQLRARQRAEVLKIPAIADMVSDAVAEGMSVAVFVNFDDSADALQAKCKTKCCIRGGQTAEERERCIAAFQADKEPVIVCNIKAGGVGVSLHGSPTARRRLAIICPTFSGQDLKQALGRVWRANGAKSIQRIFFAAGTIEEAVCRQVKAKIARIDTLNDGDLTVRGEVVTETKTTTPATQEPITHVEVGSVVAEKPEAETVTVTDELREQVHAGLRQLAELDGDHARNVNGVGFSKLDVEIGHSLAECGRLSDRQALLGLRLCRKYRRQIGEIGGVQ